MPRAGGPDAARLAARQRLRASARPRRGPRLAAQPSRHKLARAISQRRFGREPTEST